MRYHSISLLRRGDYSPGGYMYKISRYGECYLAAASDDMVREGRYLFDDFLFVRVGVFWCD